ncbi:helix-turn-helix transcriptional regulator [Paracoccus subflavus]|uniref:helix-turn-helix transcriptional regulator n=1 Tax=Paracoccus subflavus TaxID=2528244 RepID=UPI0013EF08B8|nr:AraC family transcriptional regulator [Paracoccus subflavus]
MRFSYGETRLRAGELRYIPAGTAFATVPDAGVCGHVALIARRLADTAEPPLPCRAMTVRVGPHGDQIKATLQELAIEKSKANARALSCLINLLSLRLGLLSRGNAPGRAAPNPPDRPLVDRFLDLARQRLGSAQAVAELAADLHSTVALLDQACMAAHGKRAIELIHDLQLECAALLLRNTAQPTHRIAADLGYSSHAHFVRAFAAATGRRPDVFRAQSG